MISEKERWNIIKSYFDQEGFVRHQLSSYNDFINFGISDIITEGPVLIIEPKNEQERKERKYDRYEVHFDNVYIPKPTIIEESRILREIYPAEIRRRDLTYSSPIYVNITEILYSSKFEEKKKKRKSSEESENIPDSETENKTEIKEQKNEPEIIRHNRIVIGRIPIMLRSSHCYLSSMTKKERVNVGECEYDPGGYFIVSGNEYVLVSQLRTIFNKPIVVKGKKYDYVCEMRSMSDETGHSVKISCVINNSATVIGFLLPHTGTTVIPAGILLKAFGCTNEEILNIIDLDYENVQEHLRLILNDSCVVDYNHFEGNIPVVFQEEKKKEFLISHTTWKKSKVKSEIKKEWENLTEEEVSKWIKKATQYNAIKYIGKKMINSKGEAYDQAKQLIFTDIFPHLGITATVPQKVVLIGHMIQKLLATFIGVREYDDRDNYENKRVESPGVLCFDIFRQIFKKYKSLLFKQLEDKKQVPDIMSVVPRSIYITKTLSTCFATGKWSLPKNTYVKQGVSQILSRQSYGATLSHLRRLALQVGKQTKNSAIRQIHSSQIMFICPTETPEGAPVGIVLNMALMTRISNRAPIVIVKEAIELCDNFILTESYGENTPELINYLKNKNIYKTKVFLNGNLYGYVTGNPEDFIREVKNMRANKLVPWDVSLAYNDFDEEIHVYSDEGRVLRPVFVVDEKGELNIPKEEKLNWNNLLEKRYVQYIDVLEANNSVIAFHPKELKKYKCDYCEIDSALLLGVMGSIIPFPDHSQSPRNTYQSAMGKQAMSMFALSYLIRTDTTVHVLNNPQKPLVGTKLGTLMGFDDMPGGQNVLVAIMCYGGWNQEDSIMMNFSAVQRGLFRATTYKTQKAEEEKSTCSSTKIGLPPLNIRKIGLNYNLLDENGIIRKRTPIWVDSNGKKHGGKAIRAVRGDVIVGRIKIIHNKDGKDKIIDNSVVIKKGYGGTVDEIYESINPNGFREIKIRIRKERIPEIGDKFASRAAQKGTCGMVLRQEDMPFSMSSGIVPDLIINPHCLTGNTLIELADGKSAYIKDIYNKKNILIKTVNPKTLEISNTYFKNGFVKTPKKLYEIKTVSGIKVKCTPEHKWLVIRNSKIIWIETRNLSLFSDKILRKNYKEIQKDYIQEINQIPVEDVYDFTTLSENHSFIANGLISHNCIPSRMTINQLMETVLGKSCALEGKFGDSTPFSSSSTNIVESLCERLGMHGFERTGKELMVNGMTGREMGYAFIGPVYYQRLKHLVSDKIHARANGAVTTLLRQPLDGRSRDGGLRFGEMERDCMISHAGSRFIIDSLFTRSDTYSIPVCKNCNHIPTNKNNCKGCNTDNIVIVKIPYTSKYLFQLLNSIMVKPNIHV